MLEEREKYQRSHKANGNAKCLILGLLDNVVSSNWIYRIKTKDGRTIDWFNAYVVARGLTQISIVDYDETLNPVVWPATIRLVITLSLSFKWKIRQLDIKSTFLHGNLKEIVYIEQPSGFIHPPKQYHICLFKKSIYRLKQTPRAWFDKLSKYFPYLGFHSNTSNASLFIYYTNNIITITLIYVEDILLTGYNDEFLQHLIRLSHEFAIKGSQIIALLSWSGSEVIL